jgi:hypothetical protein
MKKNLKTLWLYLAKRDKKGIQILAKFLCRELDPIKLDNIKRLALPLSWESKIFEYIEQNKLQWEPWVQTEDDFDVFKKSLKIRGYSDIPANGQPMISVLPQIVVNVNNFPEQKSMITKN